MSAVSIMDIEQTTNHYDNDDIIYLCADGKTFECQKKILIDKSDYFQAMFQSQMKESQSKQIELKGISSLSLELLLQVIVTGELEITKDNIDLLTEASCMFQVSSVIQQCCDYLINEINNDSCLNIMHLAETFSLIKVYNQARRHISWYFKDVSKTHDFYQLPKEHILEILSEKTLNVESELDVYFALESWVVFDEKCRTHLLNELIESCLHPEDLGSEELDILNSNLQQKFPDIAEDISAKLNTHLTQNNTCMEKFRKIPYTVISVGGEVPGEDRSLPFQEVLRYCMETHTFEVEAITDLSEVHTSPGLDIGYKICARGKDIIFTGGETKFGKNTWIVDVWKYDTFTHQWEVITKLQNVRRHHAMCIMGDCIYLIGGFGKYRMKLDSVEMFNCKTGKWSTLSSLPEPSFSLAATVCNGKIYAFKSRVYRYDPQENRWKIDNGDPPPFICSDALTYGKYIYLPSRYCSRLTRYDTTSNTFEEVGNFPNSKAAGSSVICDGKIYRVGISECKAFMEWYDIEKKSFNSAQELNLFLLNNNLVSVPYIKDFR